MSYDSDAQAYFTKVEAVSDFDLTALDVWATADYVKAHINAYVVGRKADGTWTPELDHALFIGPRTIAGAFEKLRGTSSLTIATGSATYNARQGVTNDANTAITTNQATSATQNDTSVWVWVASTFRSGTGRYIAVVNNCEIIGQAGEQPRSRVNATLLTSFGSVDTDGLFGFSRSSSTEYDFVAKSSAGTVTNASNANPNGGTPALFARNTTPSNPMTEGEVLSGYGVGFAINQSQVQTRFAALKTALNVFTPIGSTIQTRRRRDLGGFGL